MRALKIAATGMAAQQMRVETISNNLANMNTTGYNTRRAEFADLHYQLALGAAGRTDAQGAMTARFAVDAARQGEMPARVAEPGKAALAGLNAFAEGRYDSAFRDLAAARPTMQTIGGSHAQRDGFERMTIDAGLRAGLNEATEALIEDRIARRAGAIDRFAATRLASLQDARRIPAP